MGSAGVTNPPHCPLPTSLKGKTMIEFSADFDRQTECAERAARALGKHCLVMLRSGKAQGDYEHFRGVVTSHEPGRVDAMTAMTRLAALAGEMVPSIAPQLDAMHAEGGGDKLCCYMIATAVSLDCDAIGHAMDGVDAQLGARAFELSEKLQTCDDISGAFLATALDAYANIEALAIAAQQ